MLFPQVQAQADRSVQPIHDRVRLRHTATAACFIVALLVALQHISIHNPQPRVFLDAESFLRTSARIATLLVAPQSAHFNIADFREEIIYNGPGLPLFIATASALIGKLPSVDHSFIIFIAQAVLHAFDAAFISILARELTRSPRLGIATGLAWAVYPEAISASCLIYPEPLSTFTVVLLVFCTYRFTRAEMRRAEKTGDEHGSSRSSRIWAIALGLCTGWLLLVRSALLPMVFSINLITYGLVARPGALRLRRAALVTAGVAIILIPWMVTSRAVTGSVHVLPSRFPNWNLALGLDTYSDGWQTMPVTPFTVANCTRKPLSIIEAAIRIDPVALVSLTIRKVTRLWGRPWIEYHKRLFGLDANAMTVLHQLICLFGVFGILAVCAGIRSIKSLKDQPLISRLIGLLSLTIVVAHIFYLPFEGLPRYALTSMPFLMLLTAFSMKSIHERRAIKQFFLLLAPPIVSLLAVWNFDFIPYLVQLTGGIGPATLVLAALQAGFVGWALFGCWFVLQNPADDYSKPLNAATISFALLSLTILVANEAAPRTEWCCRLNEGQSACRTVLLPQSTVENPDWAAVLIDADQSLENALIKINGHTLHDKPVSIFDVPTSFIHQETKLYVIRLVTKSRDDQPSQLRQWRLVPCPVAFVNLNGENIMEVEPSKEQAPLTIFGDYQSTGIRRLPSLKYFTIGKLQYSLDELEGRLTERCGSEWQSVCSRSWFENAGCKNFENLSPAGGKRNGQYRIFLFLGYKTRPVPGAAVLNVEPQPDKVTMPTFVDHEQRIF